MVYRSNFGIDYNEDDELKPSQEAAQQIKSEGTYKSQFGIDYNEDQQTIAPVEQPKPSQVTVEPLKAPETQPASQPTTISQPAANVNVTTEEQDLFEGVKRFADYLVAGAETNPEQLKIFTTQLPDIFKGDDLRALDPENQLKFLEEAEKTRQKELETGYTEEVKGYFGMTVIPSRKLSERELEARKQDPREQELKILETGVIPAIYDGDKIISPERKLSESELELKKKQFDFFYGKEGEKSRFRKGIEESVQKKKEDPIQKYLVDTREQAVQNITEIKRVNTEELEAKYGKAEEGSVQWYADQVAYNTPQFITSFGLGVATGLITTNPYLATSIGFSSSFAQESSGAYVAAREAGVDDANASRIGINTGVASALIEQIPLVAFLNKSPVGITFKKNALKWIYQSLLERAKEGTLEGGTESLQQLVQNAFAKEYDTNRNLYDGVLESFVIGGILGIAGGGVGSLFVDPRTGEVNTEAEKNPILPPDDTGAGTTAVSEAINTPQELRTPIQKEIAATFAPEEAIQKIKSEAVKAQEIPTQLVNRALLNDSQLEAVTAIQDGLVSGEVSIESAKEFFDSLDMPTGVTFDQVNAEAQQEIDLMKQQEVEATQELEAQLQQEIATQNPLIGDQQVSQYVSVLNKGLRVYNLNRRRGKDDTATISNKVAGFDAAIEALENAGYTINTMEDVAKIYNKYIQDKAVVGKTKKTKPTAKPEVQVQTETKVEPTAKLSIREQVEARQKARGSLKYRSVISSAQENENLISNSDRLSRAKTTKFYQEAVKKGDNSLAAALRILATTPIFNISTRALSQKVNLLLSGANSYKSYIQFANKVRSLETEYLVIKSRNAQQFEDILSRQAESKGRFSEIKWRLKDGEVLTENSKETNKYSTRFLESPTIKNAKEVIKKETLLQGLKSEANKGLKPFEYDLVNYVLDNQFSDQPIINTKEFKDAVMSETLNINILVDPYGSAFSRYGFSALSLPPSEGKIGYLNTDYDHKVYSSGHQDIFSRGLRGASGEAKVDFVEGMFGHFRYIYNEAKKVLTVVEVQSDIYQKSSRLGKITGAESLAFYERKLRDLKEDLERDTKFYNRTVKDIENINKSINTLTTETDIQTLVDLTIERNNGVVTPETEAARETYFDILDYVVVTQSSTNQEIIQKLEEKKEKIAEQYLKDAGYSLKGFETFKKTQEDQIIATEKIIADRSYIPNAKYGKLFESYKQNYYQRMVKEIARFAADKGAEKVEFISPLSVTKVQGYKIKDKKLQAAPIPYEVIQAKNSKELKDEDLISINDTVYQLVDSSKYNFKAVRQDAVRKTTKEKILKQILDVITADRANAIKNYGKFLGVPTLTYKDLLNLSTDLNTIEQYARYSREKEQVERRIGAYESSIRNANNYLKNYKEQKKLLNSFVKSFNKDATLPTGFTLEDLFEGFDPRYGFIFKDFDNDGLSLAQAKVANLIKRNIDISTTQAVEGMVAAETEARILSVKEVEQLIDFDSVKDSLIDSVERDVLNLNQQIYFQEQDIVDNQNYIKSANVKEYESIKPSEDLVDRLPKEIRDNLRKDDYYAYNSIYVDRDLNPDGVYIPQTLSFILQQVESTTKDLEAEVKRELDILTDKRNITKKTRLNFTQFLIGLDAEGFLALTSEQLQARAISEFLIVDRGLDLDLLIEAQNQNIVTPSMGKARYETVIFDYLYDKELTYENQIKEAKELISKKYLTTDNPQLNEEVNYTDALGKDLTKYGADDLFNYRNFGKIGIKRIFDVKGSENEVYEYSSEDPVETFTQPDSYYVYDSEAEFSITEDSIDKSRYYDMSDPDQPSPEYDDHRTVIRKYNENYVAFIEKYFKSRLRKGKSELGEFGVYSADVTTEKDNPLIMWRIEEDISNAGGVATPENANLIYKLNKAVFKDDKVKITQQVLGNYKALGAYYDNFIYVLDNAPDKLDTFYHEAIHKYIDIFLTIDEQVALYETAAEKYGTDDINILEEKIAEEFIIYVNSKNSYVQQTIGQRLANFFELIIKRFRQAENNIDAIEELYQKVYQPMQPVLQETITPIGTGEIRTSTLGVKVEARAIEAGIVTEVEKLPEYQRMNLKDQGALALNFLQQNPEEAVAVALGQAQPPAGIIPESVFIAVENKAIQEGDAELIRQLATSPRVSEATSLGQRIRMLGERNADSPVARITEIVEARKQAIEQARGVTLEKETDKLKKSIETQVKKIKKGDWESFIDSIQC